MPRRLLVLALPALLALGVGGCADGETKTANAYVASVNEAQERFAAESQRLLAGLAPEDPAGIDRVALARIYGVVDRFVEELRGIEPPASVKAFHERLIAAGVRFGDRLRSAGAALTSDNASRILDGQERLAAAGAGMARSVNEAIKAINAELSG